METDAAHSNGHIPVNSSYQREVDRLSNLLQIREAQLARLEQDSRAQSGRIHQLEAKLLRALEDKDAALKTVLLVVQSLGKGTGLASSPEASAQPLATPPVLQNEKPQVETKNNRYEAVEPHDSKDTKDADELSPRQGPHLNTSNALKSKQARVTKEDIVYFEFPRRCTKAATPPPEQPNAAKLARNKEHAIKWVADLEEQNRIIRDALLGFHRRYPPRNLNRGYQQNSRFQDLDAPKGEPAKRITLTYDDATAPANSAQPSRKLISYNDAEYAEPPSYLPNGHQSTQNPPSRVPPAIRDQQEARIAYKPADGEGTGFRTVIVDGILPKTAFTHLPPLLLRELNEYIPRRQIISQQLLNTTSLGNSVGSTIMLVFYKETDAATFVSAVTTTPLTLGGQPCRVTLLRSPTFPPDSLTRHRMDAKGACRTLVVSRKPASLAAPELVANLLDGRMAVYDAAGIFELRQGVLQDLKLRQDGVVEVTFDSIATAWHAWCMCGTTYRLRQCHVEFWKDEDENKGTSEMPERYVDADKGAEKGALEEGEIEPAGGGNIDKIKEGPQLLLKDHAEGAEEMRPKSAEKADMPAGERADIPAGDQTVEAAAKEVAVHAANDDTAAPAKEDTDMLAITETTTPVTFPPNEEDHKAADADEQSSKNKDIQLPDYVSTDDGTKSGARDNLDSPIKLVVTLASCLDGPTNSGTHADDLIGTSAVGDELCLSDNRTAKSQMPVNAPTAVAASEDVICVSDNEVSERNTLADGGTATAAFKDEDYVSENDTIKSDTLSKGLKATVPPTGRICLPEKEDTKLGTLAQSPTATAASKDQTCLAENEPVSQVPSTEATPPATLAPALKQADGIDRKNQDAEDQDSNMELHTILNAAKLSHGGSLTDSKWAHAGPPQPAPKQREKRSLRDGRHGRDRDYAATGEDVVLEY